MHMAKPRSLVLKMSAMTPPALVKGDEPKVPPSNRKTTIVSMFGATAVPTLKQVKAPKVTKNTILRPYISLKGAWYVKLATKLVECV